MDVGSGKGRRAWDDEPENTTDMVEEEKRRPFSARSNSKDGGPKKVNGDPQRHRFGGLCNVAPKQSWFPTHKSASNFISIKPKYTKLH